MLDVKALISKMLTAIQNKQDKLSVTTPSISISTSTGTLNNYAVRKYGHVVHLIVGVRNANTASGGNVFAGTITTTAMRPIMYVTSGTYFGNHAVNGGISAGGAITIRNASTTALTMSSTDYATISFVYLVVA